MAGSHTAGSAFHGSEIRFSHTDPPHEQGYVLAERVRAVIGNRADYLDIESLILELGADIKRIELSDATIDGGAICDDRHGPVVLLNGASKYCDFGPGERAVLAHELCHLLFDRGVTKRLGILSGDWAPSYLEKRANAFAVELVAPQGAIRALARIYAEKELIRQVMKRFGIGEEAATKHVQHRA